MVPFRNNHFAATTASRPSDADSIATEERTAKTAFPNAVAEPPLNLPEYVRFLNRTYDELDVVLDPNTTSLWCYLRPKGPPSFTCSMLRELIVLHRQMQSLAASQEPDQEPFIRYYVLASKIPGIYNLGGDLLFLANKIRERDRAAIQYYAHRCIDVVYNISTGFDLGIVSVALIQGDALGGGLEAALSCNFIVAERGAKIGMPEILFSLFPGMGAYSMLARRLGIAMAERMMLSGRIYTADQLYDLGVIDLVVDNGMGHDAVSDYLADTRKFAARQAIYRARQRTNPITLAELRDITDSWVDTTLRLSDTDLRHMIRLQSAQSRRLLRVPTSPAIESSEKTHR